MHQKMTGKVSEEVKNDRLHTMIDYFKNEYVANLQEHSLLLKRV